VKESRLSTANRKETFMSREKAIIRELIEDIEGVTETWFELEIEGQSRKKTLVVEVGDLGSEGVRDACDEIEHLYKMVTREEKSEVSKLKIVNRSASGIREGERQSTESRSMDKASADRQPIDKQSLGKQASERRPPQTFNPGSTGAV
jgi:hypothetical protein